jgi:adenine-specific DNA-methyltransferase
LARGGLLDLVDLYRVEAGREVNGDQREEMGQFPTPVPVARFMASMLELRQRSVRVLDPGAGVGVLTAAVAQEAMDRASSEGPRALRSVAYELDEALEARLRTTLNACRAECERVGVSFVGRSVNGDFVRAGAAALRGEMFAPGSQDALGEFDCAILNPPYRKLSRSSSERKLLADAGIEVGNLYTAFLALAVELLGPGGELVAITPRSFCNGPYFKPFRKFFLDKMALRRVHVFETRGDLFGEDGVLQENVIVHAVKEPVGTGATIKISSSVGTDDDLLAVSEEEYWRVVVPDDSEAFIRVGADEAGSRVAERMGRLRGTLEGLGLEVSTGRVVDFRARGFLTREPTPETVPLVYPHNLRHGFVQWPVEHAKKPSAIAVAPETRKVLVPSGWYVLVKRFSAKEEKRRVVASLYDPERLPAAPLVGFENHLNLYHRRGKGLARRVARGLAAFLNSGLVDLYFRQFSGHTQVNATDLRNIQYPTVLQLERMGARIEKAFGDASPETSWVDQYVERELLGMTEGTADPVAGQRKIEEAREVLKALGLPKGQQNERSALTLLALLDLRPDTPWSEAGDNLLGITEMMDYFAEHYGKLYKENTRESVRRQTIHQFRDAGIVLQNPDDPARATNSRYNRYQIEASALGLVRLFGTPGWPKALATYLSTVRTLSEQYAQQRQMQRIPLRLPTGEEISLSPGGQNVLVKEIIEQFCPLYTPGGIPLYIGDTDEKWLYFKEEELRDLGVTIPEHGKMPDVVVHHVEKDWLVLIEAVTSHGPVDPKRRRELRELFSGSRAGLVLVTAFADRASLGRYLSEIAWETEVWVADAPEHVIHFNGERFLGPYE